jgi:hypothetical protein
MPPREFQKTQDKREELKTYRELKLRRDLKSIRARRRLEADGKQRVLGDGSTTRPYLPVETKRYRDVRLEVQRRLLLEARTSGMNLPVDLLLEQLAPRIEALTYFQLAQEVDHASEAHVPLPALGRALTEEERVRFAASRTLGGSPSNVSRRKTHLTALEHVLGSVEQRQSHNPARYQTVWAQLVGPEAAQQSQLDRVDPATQTAYFRCINSVLSSDLQRRPGLAQKLARALKVPVRQLRARFS